MASNLIRIAGTLIFAVLALAPGLSAGQGCSDSGFCTMGALKPDQSYVRRIKFRVNSVELTQHLGHSKYGDWIHSTFMDVNVGITKRTFFQVRLPAYTIIEGRMPTTVGWGDTFFSFTQNVLVREKFQVSATAGGKIYTSRADKKSSDGHSMPMYQQTSYGSNDLMFGLSLVTRQWMIATGYSRPLNATRNGFHPDEWKESELHDLVSVYAPSVGLFKGDDIMLRVERNFRLSRWNFYAGVLNLVRVTRDRTLDSEGRLTPVAGSDGLASNLLIGAGYQFNVHSGIRLLTASKLTERAQNPDGLSRDFVAQIAYVVRF